MIETENIFTYKNEKVFYRTIGEKSSEKGILFIHGKGSHSGFLKELADPGKDLRFFGVDLPGWGRSSGKRGHIKSFKLYFALIENFIEKVIRQAGIKEIYIAGESMGSLVAFNTCLTYKNPLIKGIIFIPGVYKIPALKSRIKRFFLFLFQLFFPKKVITSRTPFEYFTNDPAALERLKKDPHWLRVISMRGVFQIYKYMKFTNSNMDKLPVPLKIFHGRGDGYGTEIPGEIRNSLSRNKNNKITYLEKSKHWLMGSGEVKTIRSKIFSWIENECS